MKDFDAERLSPTEKDRSFRIGGRDFTYQSGVRPEVLARYFDGSPTGDNRETIAIYDETVEAFLDPAVPGQVEAWKEVRAVEGTEAITLVDIRRLIEWLIEEQAARPTGPRSDSSSGAASQTSGTPSTDASASPEAEDSTA